MSEILIKQINAVFDVSQFNKEAQDVYGRTSEDLIQDYRGVFEAAGAEDIVGETKGGILVVEYTAAVIQDLSTARADKYKIDVETLNKTLVARIRDALKELREVHTETSEGYGALESMHFSSFKNLDPGTNIKTMGIQYCAKPEPIRR